MTVIGVLSAKIDGWDTSPNTQYHIQTDEGPERYFKYQTISGQYRREKRLQDGTVVGSYGWVDADGFLRLNDYIADGGGYRITRSKRLYVGSQSSIDGAVAQAKNVPAQAGTEVSDPYRPVAQETYTPSQRGSGISRPYGNTDHSNYVHSRAESREPIYVNSPAGVPGNAQFPAIVSTIPPSSLPITSTAQPYQLDRSKFLIFPSSSQSPISANQYFRRRPTPPAGYYPTSTVAPVAAYNEEQRSQNEVAITPNVYYVSTTTRNPLYESPSSQNPLYESPSSRNPLYESPVSQRYRPTVYPVAKPQPSAEYNSNEIDQNSVYYDSKTQAADRRVYSNDYSSIRIGEGSRQPEYDGVSVTRNGFRYYLPRHYHEEETSGESRTGSFGYIDPFGIRRVIYYNASPNSGFVHRKNNRYVGFNATPYDPRP